MVGSRPKVLRHHNEGGKTWTLCQCTNGSKCSEEQTAEPFSTCCIQLESCCFSFFIWALFLLVCHQVLLISAKEAASTTMHSDGMQSTKLSSTVMWSNYWSENAWVSCAKSASMIRPIHWVSMNALITCEFGHGLDWPHGKNGLSWPLHCRAWPQHPFNFFIFLGGGVSGIIMFLLPFKTPQAKLRSWP